MKKMGKRKLILFLLLFFASDFFYSLAAWANGYAVRIGYNFLITSKVFLLSAIVDFLIFIFLVYTYEKHSN